MVGKGRGLYLAQSIYHCKAERGGVMHGAYSGSDQLDCR
jgi:hypothetical protein